ncbi:helix-turn-helix domain-containing protein [Corynebacterium suedekumii]|uniref:Helix-turn-helix domain-containing protein n=1 Tax=Corynebacterium suedekumii TaxID=3049801 RepID=A0ABY8VHI3_9CORY|nr:helix-turn-helix domain-containing protein [Corynebacterium suedekumii]WIM69116.1 helix-turn-helix domain-containing protein [Corynebacterium suedekumii]
MTPQSGVPIRVMYRNDPAAYRRDIEAWQRAVHAESGLTGVGRLVVLALAFYLNQKTGEAWPSQPTLAAVNDTSVPTVKTAMNKARELGYITSRQPPGRSQSLRYRLYLPARSPVAKSGGEEVAADAADTQEGVSMLTPEGEASFPHGVSMLTPNLRKNPRPNP